jgi:hypothetical protein
MFLNHLQANIHVGRVSVLHRMGSVTFLHSYFLIHDCYIHIAPQWASQNNEHEKQPLVDGKIMSFLFICNVLQTRFVYATRVCSNDRKAVTYALQAKFRVLAGVLLTFRRIFVPPSAGSIVQDEWLGSSPPQHVYWRWTAMSVDTSYYETPTQREIQLARARVCVYVCVCVCVSPTCPTCWL